MLLLFVHCFVIKMWLKDYAFSSAHNEETTRSSAYADKLTRRDVRSDQMSGQSKIRK